jgi:Gpi18-like mannosyltransferase
MTGDRERLREAIRYSALVFLAVRMGVTVVAVLATALIPANPDAPLQVPGWSATEITPGWHNVVTVWERFDGLWFLGIAAEGYVEGSGNAAFFPLYPLAIRALGFLLIGHLGAALLISNAAFLGALVVLYLLTASEWGEGVARRSVLYLAVFPTAYFLFAPYSEPLFLLLALLAFWGARRGRWGVAGVAAALASATRSVGIVLVPALLIEALRVGRREGAKAAVGPVLWSLLGAAGLLAYLGFWEGLSGDWLAPARDQQNWQREFMLPWVTLWTGTREAFRWIGQYPGGYHLLDWLLVVPALVAAGWVALRARASYALYAWASLLVPLSYPFPARPFLSVPRFLLVIFPLAWAAASWAERRRGVHEVMVAASAAGLGIMTALFATWHHVF